MHETTIAFSVLLFFSQHIYARELPADVAEPRFSQCFFQNERSRELDHTNIKAITPAMRPHCPIAVIVKVASRDERLDSNYMGLTTVYHLNKTSSVTGQSKCFWKSLDGTKDLSCSVTYRGKIVAIYE